MYFLARTELHSIILLIGYVPAFSIFRSPNGQGVYVCANTVMSVHHDPAVLALAVFTYNSCGSFFPVFSVF